MDNAVIIAVINKSGSEAQMIEHINELIFLSKTSIAVFHLLTKLVYKIIID